MPGSYANKMLPVTSITWSEAMKYCAWLTKRSGLYVTLPSEPEWEKAARGTRGRIYPWGNQPPDRLLCNFNNNLRHATSLSRLTEGNSPYGCADMAGNVWEWTRTCWGTTSEMPDFKYPYNSKDGREELNSIKGVFRVTRGDHMNPPQNVYAVRFATGLLLTTSAGMLVSAW